MCILSPSSLPSALQPYFSVSHYLSTHPPIDTRIKKHTLVRLGLKLSLLCYFILCFIEKEKRKKKNSEREGEGGWEGGRVRVRGRVCTDLNGRICSCIL